MEFKPYSKEYQLRHSKKDNDKPKIKEQRYKKKKKKSPLKQEVYKGRKIPTKQQRGKVTKKEYNEALRRQGEMCLICGTNQGLEAHHVKFRSDNGRGTFRNLIFLCSNHHRGNISPHQNESIRKKLELLQESKYGPYYWADRYDLFKLNLIPNTDSVTFETYMKGEEEKCRMKNGISGK